MEQISVWAHRGVLLDDGISVICFIIVAINQTFLRQFVFLRQYQTATPVSFLMAVQCKKKPPKNSPFTSKILPFIKTHLRMWRKAHLFQKCSIMCFFWKCWNQFLGNITAINKEYVSSFTFETAINVAVLYILLSFLDFCLEETQHETWWWTEWNGTHPQPSAPEMGTFRELVARYHEL